MFEKYLKPTLSEFLILSALNLDCFLRVYSCRFFHLTRLTYFPAIRFCDARHVMEYQ